MLFLLKNAPRACVYEIFFVILQADCGVSTVHFESVSREYRILPHIIIYFVYYRVILTNKQLILIIYANNQAEKRSEHSF